jgi:Holliday junction resolvasome RuvABC endonuclease subunit
LGVDPSSAKTGVCLLKDGKIAKVKIWEKDKKKGHDKNLVLYGKFLDAFVNRHKIDFVVVEKMSVSRNMDTVRVVSYYEGLSLYKAAEWKSQTISLRPMQIRKVAFGSALSKQQVYDKLKNTYKLLPYDEGGNDQSDSIAAALAGWNYIN